MKKQLIRYSGFLLCLSFVVASCKKGGFLDQTSTETLNQQKVFADSGYTFKFLNNLYTYSGQDIIPTRNTFINIPSGGNDVACLEDMTTQSVSYYSAPQSVWVTGGYTANNGPVNNYYTKYYTMIRDANLYMKMVQNAPLSDAIKKRTAAEARFLRAWYYAGLVRYYGGVTLVGDTTYSITDVITNYKRNTFKECIDYIASECDAAAPNLPDVDQQLSSDYGRITSGACLALKARMLLMAASPLFNGTPASSDPNIQPLICYSVSFDPSFWQKAADAFKAVMDLKKYALYVDNNQVLGNGFRQLFLMRQNSEYILEYMVAPSAALESQRFPASRGGSGYSSPTQNLVDQFGMANGLPITDPTSGYDPNKPYVNRDPRFYHTIIYNQASLYLASSQKMMPVNSYSTLVNGTITPATDAIQLGQYGKKTGYFSRKMANDSVSTSTSQNRVYPLIRYAEILLGYAECLNELNGPTSDVYRALQLIRERAGILPGNDNSYGLKPGLSQSQMRTIIQSEYRVELAYEGHWFYDSRRWKIAETVENQPMIGIQPVLQSNGTYVYNRLNVYANAVFLNPTMYFMPIPLAEINKSPLMIQNPGW